MVRRAKAMIPLLVPLFVSAFRRADDLATAMDARCYNGGINRTRMKQMKMVKSDYLTGGICIAFSAAVLILQSVIG